MTGVEPDNDLESNFSVDGLPELVDALSLPDRDLFHRLYQISRTVGHLVVPESAQTWIKKSFGSIEVVETQTVIRLTNMVTFEGAIFNPLRAFRPVATVSGDLARIIEECEAEVSKGAAP